MFLVKPDFAGFSTGTMSALTVIFMPASRQIISSIFIFTDQFNMLKRNMD
jgi:hypothetical protein